MAQKINNPFDNIFVISLEKTSFASKLSHYKFDRCNKDIESYLILFKDDGELYSFTMIGDRILSSHDDYLLKDCCIKKMIEYYHKNHPKWISLYYSFKEMKESVFIDIFSNIIKYYINGVNY